MRILSIIVLAFAALLSGAASAQEIAGRVLVVAGDMTILRGGQRIAAKVGSEVRTGDTLQVGALSNAQVLMSDQSVFSLRPETTLKVSEYAFQNKEPESQRAIFDLVKGGMRTLSGLIGKAKPENYGVTTKTATIGIRGTHYSLVVCEDNCRGASGSLAPNGTYGSVTDGRIAVTNQTGETVFGANQYFSVASQNAKPDQLVAPPSFLRDTLEGRAKAKKTGSEKTETQATSSPSGDANITSTVSAAIVPPTTIIPPELVQTTAQTTGLSNVVPPTNNSTIYFRSSGSAVTSSFCGSPPCNAPQVVAVTIAVNLALQRVGLSALFLTGDLSNKAFNLGSPTLPGTDGIPLTVTNGQLTFTQTFLRADYPNNQGAFRCQDCGLNGTVGYLDTMTFTGVITGSTASVTISGKDQTPNDTGGGFSVALTQTTPPNSQGAAMVVLGKSGAPTVASSTSLWGVSADSAGKLLSFNGGFGWGSGKAGTSSNTINGSNAAAGDLVWGSWTGTGAQVTDYNYNTYTTGSGDWVPWITGTVPNTIPASLGVLTYSPIGGFVNAGSQGTFNAGSLTADFINRTLSISLNATNTLAGNTFQMNGTTGISAISPRFAAGFNSVSCTTTGGAACSLPAAGNFAGFFSGANAEGAGVAFTAGFGTGSGGVLGVAAFKR